MSTVEPAGTNEMSPIKEGEIENSANVTNTIPSANVNTPPMENVNTPAENVNTPPMENVNTPAENVNTPSAPVNTPAENVNTPSAPVNTPPENVNTPSAPVNTPPQPENTSEELFAEPTAAEETPAPEELPANATIAPPALEPIAPNMPAQLSQEPISTEKTLTPGQVSVLNEQNKIINEILIPLWEKEFADIPVKYRPNGGKVAYARRLLSFRRNYSEDHPNDEIGLNKGLERLIKEFLEIDRKATKIRMGELPRSSPAPLSAPTAELVNSNTYLNSMAHVKNFSPAAADFRQHVHVMNKSLRELLHRTRKSLNKKATTPETRKAAKGLIKEFRKETEHLMRVAKRQADELEHVAKQRIREQRQLAYERIKEQAQKNLQALTGTKPTKNTTHKLARERVKRAGKGANERNFVRGKPRSRTANTNSMNLESINGSYNTNSNVNMNPESINSNVNSMNSMNPMNSGNESIYANGNPGSIQE